MSEQVERKVRIKTAMLWALILVLAQLLITQWTIKAAGNRDIIDYVSFAGTLTSLLLAVLAIVYSYFTTASQKNDADRVSSQLASLDVTIRTLNDSESRLSGELNKLTEIRAKLDDVSARVEQGGVQSSEMKSALELLQRQHQEFVEHSKENAIRDSIKTAVDDSVAPTSAELNEEESTSDFAYRFAKSSTDEQSLLMYVAYVAIRGDKGIRSAIDRFIEPVLLQNRKSSFVLDTAYGEAYGYVMVMIDLWVPTETAVRDAFLRGLSEKFDSIDSSEDVFDGYQKEKVFSCIKEWSKDLKNDIGKPSVG